MKVNIVQLRVRVLSIDTCEETGALDLGNWSAHRSGDSGTWDTGASVCGEFTVIFKDAKVLCGYPIFLFVCLFFYVSVCF